MTRDGFTMRYRPLDGFVIAQLIALYGIERELRFAKTEGGWIRDDDRVRMARDRQLRSRFGKRMGARGE